jgi:hypothetical protein
MHPGLDEGEDESEEKGPYERELNSRSSATGALQLLERTKVDRRHLISL